ncbi:MAG: response regulator transcription factor [Campylobacterales bacterium]|nr:response regulator transcription factor [Campylobacterales bacterium]
MKVFILEDERMLKESIREYIESLGHIVTDESDGEQASNLLRKEKFDLLILDINVPNKNGFEVLETLRDEKIFTPVIFVSAIIDIEDITKAFTLGCSDYIKKPFHLKELGLRIENALKKMNQLVCEHINLSKNYTYSTKTQTLFFQNEPQDLTRKQQQILYLLVKNINFVVDFEKFRHDVWFGENIDNSSIRAEINRFRKSLKEDFIKNIRGLGYKCERCLKV